MKLFTREFLDKMYLEYKKSNQLWLLDRLIHENGLTFHDAIVLMAEQKNMTPEYIKDKDEHSTEHTL